MRLDFLCDIGAVLDRFCPVDAVHDAARCEQQGADRQLLDGVGIGARGVEHHDTRLGALLDRDIIDARTCARNGEQLGVQGHLMQLCRAHHDGVGHCHILADGVPAVKNGSADLGDLIHQFDIHMKRFLL